MPTFDVDLSALKRLADKLEGVPTKLRRNVSAAAYRFCEEVMADSKEIVPVDTGTLMSTGHVELPVDTGDAITVTMGYGGPAADYALQVHENLEPHVHWQRPGSGPKYLERPWRAKQGQLPDRIKGAVKDSFQ